MDGTFVIGALILAVVGFVVYRLVFRKDSGKKPSGTPTPGGGGGGDGGKKHKH